MIGDRVERLARRIVSDDTYRLIVAPAIADLQLEARFGLRARARAYAAVWLAILGALGDEVRQDFGATCNRVALGRAAGAAALTVAAQAVLFLWMWSFNPYAHPLAFALLLPSMVTGACPAAMLPVAAVMARTNVRGVRRLITIGAVALGLIVLAAGDQAVTETNQMFREQMAAARGERRPQRGSQERTLTELWQRDDRDSRAAVHMRLSAIPLTMAWTVLGLTLTRARWFAMLGVGVVAYAFQFFSPFLAAPEDAARLPTWSPWIPVGLILLTAGICSRATEGLRLRANGLDGPSRQGPEP